MYAQIIRFTNALEQLKAKRNLVDICYENEYYDQAHFIKDYKRFTGLTPKESRLFESNELTELIPQCGLIFPAACCEKVNILLN